MNIEEIKKIARAYDINPGRLKKIDLIRHIQAAEGYEQCFKERKAGSCGQDACIWRSDCN